VCNLCCGTVYRGDVHSSEVSRCLLMSMTSAVVLYDRITDDNVFRKNGNVAVSDRVINSILFVSASNMLSQQLLCTSYEWHLLVCHNNASSDTCLCVHAHICRYQDV
jgi:hypothetical protein